MEVIPETRVDLPEEVAESSLPAKILFDNFTMGVLWLLNVAPTQLHPNSWGYHQAFHVLCQSLYLRHSPQCFLYSYDTRPKSPITWLSLINHPGISMLDAFSQSFKHFKDGFFKVVVKEASCSHFYNEDRITKFPFSWTDNPWWYKDMKKEELSARDRGVVEILGRFSNKLSTKGLIRAYLSVHPLVDLEVDVHVHGGSKRKASALVKHGARKELKKVRSVLLGPKSSSWMKKPESGKFVIEGVEGRMEGQSGGA
ncbi:hypothetical protein DEO72_LG10g1485 [Vigna unguiculata]|uniref:Uncharacterized protein n=1 Tax=Vigna unguiculata TaxID=3917 RepID=A0A4D6NED8_VIGUN|nr:hypothetical protein DEO72_LG10g1485 [Vigna unguiculata]